MTRALSLALLTALLTISFAPSQTNPKIDINLASVSELQKLPGITTELARKIVAERPYARPADLNRAGISELLIKRIIPLIKFSAVQPETPGPQGGVVASAAPDRGQADIAIHDPRGQLRSQLLRQLNLVFETRDTARGLVVNMSDVLFSPASAALTSAAKERLAKIAAIVLAHPGLKLEAQGQDDNVAAGEDSQLLSRQRADSVRDYLVAQGIPGSAILAKGSGKNLGLPSYGAAMGRGRSRRVALIVSGEAIEGQ